ncbi:DUF2155 domain-containing protein [Ciceribacter sp. L1K23]|nr:DUF2155 domain-containing protein [Ciceribacter sp. L1K23]
MIFAGTVAARQVGTLATAVALTGLLALPGAAHAERISNPVAVFAGIDKITGRITTFDVYVNETVQFGALQVTPKVCYSRDEEEAQKTDAFIEVDEITLDRKIRRIFSGWMFADSPALNAVEHPIYDVWLTDCKATSDVPAPEGVQAATPAPVPKTAEQLAAESLQQQQQQQPATSSSSDIGNDFSTQAPLAQEGGLPPADDNFQATDVPPLDEPQIIDDFSQGSAGGELIPPPPPVEQQPLPGVPGGGVGLY